MNDDDYLFAVAELAAHAINHLDGWPDSEELLGCCYKCCAPCHALHALYVAGHLNTVVQPFIDRADQWSWWRYGEVDPLWLERGWRDSAFHPVHGLINGRRPGLLGREHPQSL